MNIIAIPAFHDNYIWLLQQGSEVVCVDPGDATPVRQYLEAQRLQLAAIWLTHHHNDHIGGVAELKRLWPQATVYGHQTLGLADVAVAEGSRVPAFNAEADVWAVPGHTDTHLASVLHGQGAQPTRVFCGDTLFSAGCGRVFTGTAAQLHHSLQRLNTLPENTLFYPAHEYTAANLRFADAEEPGNADFQAALAAAANTPTLPVTLAHERRVNPFLRTDKASVQAAAVAAGLPADQSTDGAAVFAALREWKNRF